MTVSPPWPQDGNQLPKAADNGVGSDEGHRSPPLPPTLFALPNLDRVSSAVPATTPAIQRTPSPAPVNAATPEPEFPSWPPSPQPVPAMPRSETAPHRMTPQDSDDRSKSSTPPAVSVATETPATRSNRHTVAPAASAKPPAKSPLLKKVASSDVWAIRSWMETLGSHGVIAVLLMLVVAAALLTGRESNDLESEDSLAEIGELLDFDDGTRVDLPIPPHELSASDEFQGTADTTFPDRPVATSMEGHSIAAATDSAEAQQPNAIVSLATPQASSTLPQAASMPDSSTEPLRPMSANGLNGGPSGAEVMAAASRVATQPGDPTLPSLEDLTDDSTGYTPADTKTQAGPKRVFSKTPLGVSDWLQYLPNYRTAAAAEANAPSNSNPTLTR